MRNLSKSAVAAFALIATARSVSTAAIIPSWRLNTITPEALAASPQLAGAVSVSLMVELTGGSLFNVAGLDLSFMGGGGAPTPFYNQFPFGGDARPSPALIAVFPDLAFDTYVATTDTSAPAVPGKLNGVGTAQVGNAGAFNVAWGATPNTGGTGPLEIARITFLPTFGLVAGFPTTVALSNGFVADSIFPNTNIALPPIPVGIIPEPVSFALAGLGIMVMRRRRG